MTRLTPEQIAEIKARHEADWKVINSGGSYYLVNVPQIEQDRADLLSHIESDGWQTMETAPRDGTLVDLWLDVPAQAGGAIKAKSYRVSNCQWMKDEWWRPDQITRRQSLLHADYVTHWRPLPAPPETKEG